MSLLSRLLAAVHEPPPAPPPAPAAPPAIDAPCPECQGEELGVIARQVRASFDGATVIEVPVGARYSCQRCGHEFAVSRHGIYQPHRWALPITVKPPRRESEPTTQDPPADGDGPKPPRRDTFQQGLRARRSQL